MAKDLAEQLNDALMLYSAEVTEQIKEEARDIAEETRIKIRDSSPQRTKKYRRGWKAKKVFENANEVRYRIYNTRHQITHLLEKGHARKGGGKVAPRIHIRPAETWAQREFMKRIKKAVQK